MISVIIATRNRAEFLNCALTSLAVQERSNFSFEIIVVDNGSSDHTQEIIRKHSLALPNVISIYTHEPGLHVGRHAGMLAAHGDILLFADDDIEALPSWLCSVHDAFSDRNVALVGGNNFPLFLEAPPAWLEFMWSQKRWDGFRAIPALSIIEFSGARRPISPYYVWGCNFAVRKSVLLAAGGFHPDGMPDELVRLRGDGETHVARFVAKSGMKCLFDPGASVFHKVAPERMTAAYFYKRGFAQGISDSYSLLRSDFDTRLYSRIRCLLTRVLGCFVWPIRERFSDPGVSLVLHEMRKGYRQGFAYHQYEYKRDPELRAWVHKSRYF